MKLIIDNCEFKTTLGVFEWERLLPQLVSVSLVIDLGNISAQKSDNLEDTLDYQALCEQMKHWADNTSARLIEHLAAVLKAKIEENFGVKVLSLTLKKPNAIANAQVGVCLD